MSRGIGAGSFVRTIRPERLDLCYLLRNRTGMKNACEYGLDLRHAQYLGTIHGGETLAQ